MNIRLCFLYVFLNGWIDFDDIFCVWLSGFLNDLDTQLEIVGPIQGGAKTGIFRFTMDIFVYKWLLFIGSHLLIGEIVYNQFFTQHLICYCTCPLSNVVYRGGWGAFRSSKLHPKGVEQSQFFKIWHYYGQQNVQDQLYYNKLEEIWHINFVQIYLLKIEIFGLNNVGQDS